jgi:hypothetical protein
MLLCLLTVKLRPTSRAELQILNLANCNQEVRSFTLELPPEDKLETAKVVFSPGLELVLIGKHIFKTKSSHSKAIITLPLPILRESIQFNEAYPFWKCEISPCASYFAAVAYPTKVGEDTIQFHIYKLNVQQNSYEVGDTRRIPRKGASGLGFHFHPVQNELLLCDWKSRSRDGGLVTTFNLRRLLLDYAEMKLESFPVHKPVEIEGKYFCRQRCIAWLTGDEAVHSSRMTWSPNTHFAGNTST